MSNIIRINTADPDTENTVRRELEKITDADEPTGCFPVWKRPRYLPGTRRD